MRGERSDVRLEGQTKTPFINVSDALIVFFHSFIV